MSTAITVPIINSGVEILYALDKEGVCMQLLVENFGTFLGKKSERVVVKEKGELKEEIPLRQLEIGKI